MPGLPAAFVALGVVLCFGVGPAMRAHLAGGDSAPGFVVTYPTPPGEQASRNFSVTVNGEPVFVHNCREASYVHFAFAGRAEVTVTVSEEVESYDLSPHSYGIESKAEGREITFTLAEPRKLILHRVNASDGDVQPDRERRRAERRAAGADVAFPVSEEVLCILADPPEDDAPKPGDAGVVTIMDSGVDATGKTDESERIQKAIDATPAGGVLYFPPGRYTFTELLMKSDRSVYLAGGAVLQSSEEHAAKLLFTGASNGRLYGRGVIDGKGYIHRARAGGREEGSSFLRCEPGSGSHDYAIEDVIIRNAPLWTAIFFDTSHWRIYNVKIVNDRQFANRDGIAPHDSRNTTIENVFMYVSDDPIPYSTTRPGLELNSIVKNCVFYNNRSGTCIRLGPWIGDGTSNFTAENTDFVKNARNDFALGFYIGGTYRDIAFRNIRVEDPGYGLLRVYTEWEDYYAGKQEGSLENVVFDTFTCEMPVRAGIELQAGSAEHAIRGITFRNLSIAGQTITDASQTTTQVGAHVSGLTFETTDPKIVGVKASGLIASTSSPGEFTFTRTGDTTDSLTLRYRVGGTARNGGDYQRIPDTITIPAGGSTATLTIQPLADAFVEGYRTAFLTLEHGDAFMLGPDFHAQVTIVGD